MVSEPWRKRPRGQRQRLKRAREEGDEYEYDGQACETSALALLLLNLFAWGFFSPQRVQQIAEQAVKDIERSKDDPRVLKDLYTLANLGAKGKYPNNIHSELMNKVEHVPQLPKPYAAKVPLKGFPDSVQHMLLPHEMFACIWRTAGYLRLLMFYMTNVQTDTRGWDSGGRRDSRAFLGRLGTILALDACRVLLGNSACLFDQLSCWTQNPFAKISNLVGRATGVYGVAPSGPPGRVVITEMVSAMTMTDLVQTMDPRCKLGVWMRLVLVS